MPLVLGDVLGQLSTARGFTAARMAHGRLEPLVHEASRLTGC